MFNRINSYMILSDYRTTVLTMKGRIAAVDSNRTISAMTDIVAYSSSACDKDTALGHYNLQIAFKSSPAICIDSENGKPWGLPPLYWPAEIYWRDVCTMS